MKARTITQETGFDPVTIEITIESADELRELYARFNVATTTLRDGRAGVYPNEQDIPNVIGGCVFDIIEALSEERLP